MLDYASPAALAAVVREASFERAAMTLLKSRIESDEVLAAVTASVAPVQGCRKRALGALRYAAVAAPEFASRPFFAGVTPASLNRAAVPRFDAKDRLQQRWARENFGVDLAAPTHGVPCTQGFVGAALVGLGWSMSPLALVADHIAAGRPVHVHKTAFLDVPLHWQHARLGARAVGRTDAPCGVRC